MYPFFYEQMIKKMKLSCLPLVFLTFIISTNPCSVFAGHINKPQEFINCLNHPKNGANPTLSSLTFTPSSHAYSQILDLDIQNLLFKSDKYPKPDVIVTPRHEAEIKPVILCAKEVGMQVRIRCGGHDFEGQSFVSEDGPFVMINMINLRSVDVDVKSRTAWIQGGANLGEVYYNIAQESDTLAFTGGVWATVGVGGFIGGGGYGPLKRKYGLAADNVIDARLMDAKGNILDRESMGEDLFWAIRGGVASNFGVVLAWKVNLVEVPEVVTVFAVDRTLEQNGTQLLYKWQTFAPFADRDLYFRAQMFNARTPSGQKTVRMAFQALFLGRADRLLSLMGNDFPELGLKGSDCHEMSYIQSMVYIAGDATFIFGGNTSVLLDRSAIPKVAFKGTSDYVKVPIPIEAYGHIWKMYAELDVDDIRILCTPYGGRMAEFAEDTTPFPRRAGYLYSTYEAVNFPDGASPETMERFRNWHSRLYKFLTPYVSSNPRAAYANYNDLDLGVGSSSYEEASKWGKAYWGDNFDRLIKVKSKVDPENFFRHAQSIPTSSSFSPSSDEL